MAKSQVTSESRVESDFRFKKSVNFGIESDVSGRKIKGFFFFLQLFTYVLSFFQNILFVKNIAVHQVCNFKVKVSTKLAQTNFNVTIYDFWLVPQDE